MNTAASSTRAPAIAASAASGPPPYPISTTPAAPSDTTVMPIWCRLRRSKRSTARATASNKPPNTSSAVSTSATHRKPSGAPFRKRARSHSLAQSATVPVTANARSESCTDAATARAVGLPARPIR